MNKLERSRRRFVQLVASGITVGIAGCNGNNSDDNTDDTTDASNGSGTETVSTSGAIQGTSVEETNLVVNLDPEQSVSTVTITGPDGEVWSDSDVVGSATHEVNLFRGDTYPPGTQSLEARDSDGNVVGSATLSLNPEVSITAFGLGAEYSEEIDFVGEDRVYHWRHQPVVELENTGTGPDVVSRLDMAEVVDYYDPADVKGDAVLPPGGTGTIWGGSQLFSRTGVDDADYTCGTSASLDLILGLTVSEDIETTVTINSELAENADSGGDLSFGEPECNTTGELE